MAAGNREHPRARHVAVAVRDTHAVAIVRNVPAEHRGKTELPFDLGRINTPPFDDSFPPSNVAVIVFPPTGDRPGRNSVASVMVSGASCWSRTILFRQQNHTRAGRFSPRSPPKNPRRHE